MTTTTFLVSGMTCEHCVRAVTTEVGTVSNVTDVQVDLDAGQVSVESNGVLDTSLVLKAITAAGYTGQLI